MKLIYVGLVCAGALTLAACGEVPPDDENADSTTTVSQAATTVTKTKWNGASASVSVPLENGWAYVSAYEDVTKTGRTTYLNYQRSVVDPSSYTCWSETYCDWLDPETCETYEWCDYTRYSWEYAWGEIPSQAFRAGKSAAHLTVDIANLPDFYSEVCTVDYAVGTYECTNGTGTGNFDLAWVKNKDFSYSNNGTSRYTFGKYSYKSVGQWSSTSANVSGVAFGSPLQGVGDISQSKGSSVSKEISPATP
jgi:predicted small lipoprotein YifL